MPPVVVAVARAVCWPCPSAPVTALDQLPLGSAVVVPIAPPSIATVMVAPAGPVPLTMGVVVVTWLPLAGATTTGALGTAT